MLVLRSDGAYSPCFYASKLQRPSTVYCFRATISPVVLYEDTIFSPIGSALYATQLSDMTREATVSTLSEGESDGVSQRIRQARQEHGMNLAQLGGTELSRALLSGVESFMGRVHY